MKKYERVLLIHTNSPDEGPQIETSRSIFSHFRQLMDKVLSYSYAGDNYYEMDKKMADVHVTRIANRFERKLKRIENLVCRVV